MAPKGAILLPTLTPHPEDRFITTFGIIAPATALNLGAVGNATAILAPHYLLDVAGHLTQPPTAASVVVTPLPAFPKIRATGTFGVPDELQILASIGRLDEGINYQNAAILEEKVHVTAVGLCIA